MTCMRARRKRLSLCVQKSTWILTELIIKRKRPKIQESIQVVQGIPVRKRFGGLGDFQLYSQHHSLLHFIILYHDMTARLNTLLALHIIVPHWTNFNYFSMMVSLTCWLKIQISMPPVKMLEVMG